MDGSPRIVYLDSQIGEQCMQNANDITIRLLIVDDSGENAEAIVSTLRNSGIAVRPWRPQDAAELSQVLSSQAIDLVLASPSQGIPLPLVAQHIAASGKDIPLVLLADRIDEDELVQASSHGIRALALRQRSEHLLAVVRDQWVDLQARRGLRRIEAQMRETERRCDALIVASCLPADDQSYRKVQAAGTPVIALDRALDAEHFCSVVSDDCEAAALLTRSLAVPAAAHIALISARPALPISQQREEGFRQALSQHSGQVSILQAEQFSRACGREQMLALLDRGPLPDALITTAYVLLEGVFDALRERDLLWPEHLRLATFGDAQLLDFLPIRVNAISQQHEQIAEQTLEQAIRAIEQGDYRPGVIAIERELKVRRG